MLGLYIHIPFCNSLCKFCDFPKRINQKPEVIKAYLDKLISDLLKINTEGKKIDTVYLGGGTPNLLSLDNLDRLLGVIAKLPLNSDLEYTIEGNFELITEAQVKLFKKYGINRVSLGVQTLNKEIGKHINRVSDYEVLKAKINLLHQYGIDNINCDFIFGLPKETLNDVKKDLEKIKKLDITHISYYSLILEDKSVLGYELKHHLETLPSYEEVDKMNDLIQKTLNKMGYKHYEISNYAKDGYESKHNKLYWSLDDYIGIGMSAASFYKGKRYTNSNLIKDYLEDKNISYQEFNQGEYFWLGLRMLDGVSLEGFKERFHEDPLKLYAIDDLIKKGLVIIDNDYLKLTDLGLGYGNYVFEYFI